LAANPIPTLTEKDKNRFWSKVGPLNENGCREWLGSKVHPYGRFSISGKQYYSHRMAWFLANGPIAPGKLVCHKCDNPYCLFVGHLFLGTQKDNMGDAVKKGRMARGENNTNSKLTNLDVLEMRKRYFEGETQVKIAKDYEVGQTQVSNIVNRTQWASV